MLRRLVLGVALLLFASLLSAAPAAGGAEARHDRRLVPAHLHLPESNAEASSS